MQNKKRGFTLIELLVVIAIIGLLASVVMVALTSSRAKARDASRVSNLRSLQTALELYAGDHSGKYPIASTWQSQCAGWGSYAPADVIPGLVPSYIPVMPSDPGMIANSNKNCYLYQSNGTDYKLLDYVHTSDVDTGSQLPLIDPLRNAGRAWQVPDSPAGPCTNNGDVSATWAIWSSPNSQCW